MTQPPELKKFKRHLSNARRELTQAVERFAEIDALEGHRVEAARRAHAVRDEAEKLVRVLDDKNPA